jgi:leucyl-tRNA synthetase
MPIAAAAQKIDREVKDYGNPPNFPPEVEDAPEEEGDDDKKEEVKDDKKKKKKGKVANKKSAKKYQWQILEEMKVPNEKIASFSDPMTWLHYFPPIGEQHLRNFGLKVDWRRSFITTSLNPYYDAFIRWQFNTLKKLDLIDFGKRVSIFSVLNNQACADHDRESGEGVGPQEYTGIKMRLLEPFPKKLEHLSGRKVFLVAATLRPETMYGQTNCWILPRGQYGAFEMNYGEVFICSERAALNMSCQELSPSFGKPNKLADLEGWDLLGKLVQSPNAIYQKIYVLPLLTISMEKGTGVVTSVPSDSPDDFVALRDLQTSEEMRKKYYITDEMVTFVI